MNVVLVTSVLRPVNDSTIFNVESRREQTINTIKTVREKIPNSYIVMVEGGKMEELEFKMFSCLVDHLFKTDVSYLRKSPGEASLLYRYLISDHFKGLDKVNSVSKLSGRYILNEKFSWSNFPKDKIIISFVKNSWMNKPLYNTRYYCIPIFLVQDFIDGLNRYIKSPEFQTAYPDIEHCFYQHNIINFDKIYTPEIIGVSGLLTGNGNLVMD